MKVDLLARVGGIFSLLVLIHFVADWVFQSHAEAMAKPTSPRVRLKHCAIYTTLCLIPLWALAEPSWRVLAVSAGILFLSHYLEDTYLLVFLWAKYLRRPPEMAETQNVESFRNFANTVLGKILLITIDQLVHILFLLPVAVMVVFPHYVGEVTRFGICSLGMLAALVLWGDREIRT